MSLPEAAISPLVQSYKVIADNTNNLATQIKAATQGADALYEGILTTSDDERLVKFREWLKVTTEQIENAKREVEKNRAAALEIAKTLNVESTENFNVEDAKAEFMIGRQSATALRKALLGALGNDEAALAALIEKNGIVEVQSLRVGGKTTGATGVRKPRLVSAEIDGARFPEDETKNPTFTTLAKELSVDVEVLKAAAFKAAETDDLMALPEGTKVSFDLPVKDGTKSLVIIPKHREDDKTEAAA